jgi:ATP-dependent helicase/DNAse subunit B
MAREGLVFSPSSIVTLSGFTNQILGDVGVADPIATTLAVETAVEELDPPQFTRVRGMSGFLAALVQTIGELDAAGCDPDQFARVRVDAPLARPLLAVWRATNRRLAADGLLTRSQLLRRATEKIRERVRCAKPPSIWFDGFAGFTRPELELIEALAATADVTVALPDLATAGPAIVDLHTAGFELEELEPRGEAPAASYFRAENIEREADEIARRIVLYHELGRDFKDIAVALRNPSDHAALLEATFERYGIPARFYFGSMLAEHPIAAFGIRLIEALLSGWDLETTLAAMRLAPSFAAADSFDHWDIQIRERIPGAGLDLLREAAADDPRSLKILDRLAELNDLHNARWTPQRWADVLSDIPDRFRPPRPRDGIGPNEAAILRGHAASTEAWRNVHTEAAKFAPPGLLSLEEFWHVASSMLRLTSLNVSDNRRNVVNVMSVFEARQWDPPVMFLPNLVEKVFPKYHAQDPFLPDSAIRQLQNAGFRLRTGSERDEEERCLFDALTSRSGREICLSYPRLNGRGDENLCSSFLNRLRTDKSEPLPSRPAPIVPPLLLRPAAEIRSDELVVHINHRAKRFSPSGLECYARCPFQFFASRTLNLESLPDSPEERLSYLVQGNIVHDTLKRWTPVRGPVKPHFAEAFEGECKRQHIQHTYRTEVLRRNMLANLEKFCDNFPIYGEAVDLVEKDFDFALLPGVQLRGRIDRVDRTAAGRAIVVDYKYSGQMKQNVEDSSKLQGVLYTLAARNEFGLSPQATIFVSVKKDVKPVGWGELADYDLRPLTQEWLDNGLETVARLATEIRAGTVRPRPSDTKHCRYCDFRDACRYESAEAVSPAHP